MLVFRVEFNDRESIIVARGNNYLEITEIQTGGRLKSNYSGEDDV